MPLIPGGGGGGVGEGEWINNGAGEVTRRGLLALISGSIVVTPLIMFQIKLNVVLRLETICYSPFR